jgi:hypothetical protein
VRHQIRNDGSTVVIELTGVGSQQEELLAAFAECQSGRCSCPTDEYQKVASIEVQPGEERVTLRLQPQPDTTFDSSQIAACLDHTVGKVTSGEQPSPAR